MTYTVTDACTACGACLLTCPEHAIVAGLPLVVRADRCTSCGECVEVCPADAILETPAGQRRPARPHAQPAGRSSASSAGDRAVRPRVAPGVEP